MLVDNDGGIEAAATFDRVFAAGGGKIVGEVRVPSTNKDFSAYMERAKEAAPQAVFAVLLNGTGAGSAFVKSFNGSGMAKRARSCSRRWTWSPSTTSRPSGTTRSGSSAPAIFRRP